MKLEKKNITKQTKIVLGVLLLTSFFLTISYLTTIVFGWVGPTQNPPYGNVSFKNSCENVFNEWCSGLGEVCYVVREYGNGGTVIPECVPIKEDGSMDAPEFIPNVEGDFITMNILSGSLGVFNSSLGIFSDIQKQTVEVCFGCLLFGDEPGSLEGVGFYDGTPEVGMIVFKTPGTYSITPTMTADAEVLVVAGGGGGGGGRGGGGGAGGTLYYESFELTKVEMSVIVGAGGSGGGTNNAGQPGFLSSFSSISANGGGGGRSYRGEVDPNGGSGGGGAAAHDAPYSAGGTGVLGQGNDGGSGAQHNLYGTGGGGGGAGAVGSNAPSIYVGGNGGVGLTKFGYNYAGGGGGGAESGYTSGLGVYGGGNGSTHIGSLGVSNSGGGGGGGGRTRGVGDYAGGTGGSGIVIVRWGGYSKNYNPTTDAVWD